MESGQDFTTAKANLDTECNTLNLPDCGKKVKRAIKETARQTLKQCIKDGETEENCLAERTAYLNNFGLVPNATEEKLSKWLDFRNTVKEECEALSDADRTSCINDVKAALGIDDNDQTEKQTIVTCTTNVLNDPSDNATVATRVLERYPNPPRDRLTVECVDGTTAGEHVCTVSSNRTKNQKDVSEVSQECENRVNSESVGSGSSASARMLNSSSYSTG